MITRSVRRTHPTLSLFPVLFTSLLFACGGGSGGGGAPALNTIEVTPVQKAIAAGTSVQFVATGIYSNGSTRDLTEDVSWESSDPGVATVNDNAGQRGRAVGLVQGSVEIRATLGSRTGTSTLEVTAAVLTTIEVTPTLPSIALGTSQQFAATGIFSDTTHQDLTDDVTWDSSAPAIATVNASGGLAASVATGTVTITASLGAISGSTDLTVTAAVLVAVEVTPTIPSIALGTTQQFLATGIFSDTTHQDLTASAVWSSTDVGVATVSNDPGDEGLADSVAVGTTTIAADFGGLQGSTTLTVGPAVLVSIGVTPTDPTVPLGLTQAMTASGVYTDATVQDLTDQVTWSSSNGASVSVSNAGGSEGVVSALASGSATVQATFGAIRGATTVTVGPAALVSIDVTPPNDAIALGETLQFTATGIFSDASNQDVTDAVTWSSSAPAVATVSNAAGSEGLATSVATGMTTVTATQGAVSGSTGLTIDPAALTSLEVTPVNPDLPLGLTQQFTATGIYSDLTVQDLTTAVTWSSTTPAVAAVSNAAGSEGLATSVTMGTTTVAATLGVISGSTDLTVTAAVLTALDVTPSTPSIPLGNTRQFTATGTYSDASTRDLTTAVAWTSSSEATATVSNAGGSEGLATSVATGSTTVTAAMNSVSGSTVLTVTAAALVSIDVSPEVASMPLGNSQQMTATGYYTDATSQDLTDSVTWTSSMPAVATVSNAGGTEGVLSSAGTGSTTITATQGAISGDTDVTITAAVLTSLAVTPATPSVPLGNDQPFTAIGTYSDATTQDLTTAVTWSSSSPGVAQVSNAGGTQGYATSVAIGSTTITATSGAVSGGTDLTITAATLTAISITPLGDLIAVGTNEQFTAMGTFSDASVQDITGTVTWSSSDPLIATISNAGGSEGLVSGIDAGTVTITATDGSLSTSTTLDVAVLTLVSIAVTPADASMANGGQQQYTAIGTYNDASTQDLSASVAWKSSVPGTASVSNNGVVKAHGVGLCQISATFNSVVGTTSLTVTP